MTERDRRTTFLLKRGVGDAIRSDGRSMRPLALSGNDLAAGKKRQVQVVPVSRVRTVRENLLKIQQCADPIDFLIRVQNGELIPVQMITDEGDVVTTYESAALADRIAIAKFMASKVLPSLTVTKHLISDDDETPHGMPTKDGRGPSFAQLVAAAASRASPEVEGTVYEAEIEEGEDGGTAADADD